jgi:hypothetical protein
MPSVSRRDGAYSIGEALRAFGLSHSGGRVALGTSLAAKITRQGGFSGAVKSASCLAIVASGALKKSPVIAKRALVAHRGKSRSACKHGGASMTSRNPQPDIYNPNTLAVMDQAFAAIWNIGHKLLNLVADGVTDPVRLGGAPSRGRKNVGFGVRPISACETCPRLAPKRSQCLEASGEQRQTDVTWRSAHFRVVPIAEVTTLSSVAAAAMHCASRLSSSGSKY